MADSITEKMMGKAHKDANRMVPETRQMITRDKLKDLLPRSTNIAVTDEIVHLINHMEDDTGLPQELLEEDLMSYMHLLGGMKGVGMKALVNAIKFCNLKRNYTNKEAWSIAFPVKYTALVEANKQVDNHVSMYNSSKLVVAIDKEMLIPVSLTYAPYFHAATKELYKIGVLGKGGKSAEGNEMTVTPMVRVQALKELTTLTKPPEEQKLAITVNPGAEAITMQEEMNLQLKALVAGQKQRLDNGEDIIDVQAVDLAFDDIKINGN